MGCRVGMGGNVENPEHRPRPEFLLLNLLLFLYFLSLGLPRLGYQAVSSSYLDPGHSSLREERAHKRSESGISALTFSFLDSFLFASARSLWLRPECLGTHRYGSFLICQVVYRTFKMSLLMGHEARPEICFWPQQFESTAHSHLVSP